MKPNEQDAEIAKITGVQKPYSSCLNAMREAVSAIESPNMQLTFGNNLIEVCDRDKPKAVDTFHIINATAAQRAEAFLRTIGKWEEDLLPTIPATGNPITQQEIEDKE